MKNDLWAPIGSVWESVDGMPCMLIAVVKHTHPLSCMILFLDHVRSSVVGTTMAVGRGYVTQNFTRVT